MYVDFSSVAELSLHAVCRYFFGQIINTGFAFIYAKPQKLIIGMIPLRTILLFD